MYDNYEITTVESLGAPTLKRTLSEKAKDRLEASEVDLGYTRTGGVDRDYITTVHELRIFGVLSLLMTEGRILGAEINDNNDDTDGNADNNNGNHLTKSAFCVTEIMNRHKASDCRRLYNRAINRLLDVGLIKSHETGESTVYYVNPEVGLGPAFDISSEEELKNLKVMNEDAAEASYYQAVVLPGIGDLIEAVENNQLFVRPVALGKAALSVGSLLALVGIAYISTPRLTPSIELLVVAWMILSTGITATTVGGYQRGASVCRGIAQSL